MPLSRPRLYAPGMPNPPRENPADAIRGRLRPLRGQLWALVVLFSSLTLVVVLWRMAYERELRSTEAIFVADTDDIAGLLKQRMVNFELVTGGGISLFASVARPTPEQWFGYVEGMELTRRFPSIAGLGFAGYLRHSRLQDLQDEWQYAGWGELAIHPQIDQERLAVVLYLEPKTVANLEVIGYDMYSDPVRRTAMVAAMESGEPTLSGAVQLVQGEGDNADKLGLLLFRPVYRGNGQPDTVAARLDAI